MKRKENGITLIALIITIIILVILAAVSIRAVTNMGIVGHAINGTQKYAEGAVTENEMLGTTGNTIDSAVAKIKEIQGESESSSTGENGEEAIPTTYTISTTVNNGTYTGAISIAQNGTATVTISANTNYSLPSTVTVTGATQNYNSTTGVISLSNPTGNVTITANCTEIQTNARASLTSQLPLGETTFTAGTEVTFGGEQFFVLSDDGTNVKLLTKYCLNKTGTAQCDKDATTSTYGRRFSKTDYWFGSFDEDPFNLQSETMISKAENDGDAASGIPNAVLAAQFYGTAKGATGRLMTYVEANEILNGGDSTMIKILGGGWDDETKPVGWLYWWLGDAAGMSEVWYVYAMNSSLMNQSYDGSKGVRVVLEVN